MDDHDEGVIDTSGIKPMDENLPLINDGGACIEFNCLFGYNICSSASHYARNHEGIEGVTFSNHANSLFIIVASNIWNIHLTKVNESLHSGLKLHHVNDGLGNSVCRLKDWHETMFSINKKPMNKKSYLPFIHH
jgi:hypothetical protein